MCASLYSSELAFELARFYKNVFGIDLWLGMREWGGVFDLVGSACILYPQRPSS